jgi:predicted RNA-binding Zn-ribbon protein involved in translation (DUF1610 family)
MTGTALFSGWKKCKLPMIQATVRRNVYFVRRRVRSGEMRYNHRSREYVCDKCKEGFTYYAIPVVESWMIREFLKGDLEEMHFLCPECFALELPMPTQNEQGH